MRVYASIVVLAMLSACSREEIYFIPGSATLPDCTDPPATNLDGTSWYDNGTVTVLSSGPGCDGAVPDDKFTSCALTWVFTQSGNDVEIIVDGEYRINGRLCDDELHLQGGWWLPVVADENDPCVYEDDDGEEVGIQAGGNTLTWTLGTQMNAFEHMTGTLRLGGPCEAEYEVLFQRSP